jgi:hypothetical protein
VTATEVDGKAVIAVEPAKSSFRGSDGERVSFRQMLRLLLDDGSEVYGCLHCDYTSPNLNSVRPHLNKHRKAKQLDEAEELAAVGVGLSLAQITRALRSHERTVNDLEEWKRRALTAERQLRLLRKALGVTA